MSGLYIERNELLAVLSESLDRVEMEVLHVTQHHAKRVAWLCVLMGKKLYMTEEEISDLVACALLHDSALNEYKEEYEKGKLRVGGDVKRHCIKGEKNIFLASSDKSNMPYAIDLSGNIPTLADITEKAIELLDDPKGFFLMVEGGLIDYAGHGNETAANLYETLAFDEAVRKAYAFYKKHPAETLIIVTGDHETGGLTLGVAGGKFSPEVLAHQKCSAGAFKSKLDALQKAGKIKSFEDVKALITQYCGFQFTRDSRKNPMILSKKEQQELAKAYESKKLHNILRLLVNRKAGTGWTTGSHTAIPVITTAVGNNAEKFSGLIENTDIADILKNLL